jgi:hypothetical protein
VGITAGAGSKTLPLYGRLDAVYRAAVCLTVEVRGAAISLLLALAGAGLAGFLCVIGANPDVIDDLSEWNREPGRWLLLAPSIGAAASSFGIGLAAVFFRSRRRHLALGSRLLAFAVAFAMFMIGFATAAMP